VTPQARSLLVLGIPGIGNRRWSTRGFCHTFRRRSGIGADPNGLASKKNN